ncbi:hypothetical protein [Niveibacterium sp. COAC-50]|uniref:hypothetical protein n=1 Tax=Niveibacterium sp. COAC-50 TaxID=2729384 RepID=UPI0015562B50|nr:hypothetical protein [Niveibacterium sp. COAC-50]
MLGNKIAALLLTVLYRTANASEPSTPPNYGSSEWWLVYLTAALSIFTLGLMIYTAKMWRATVELSKEAKANSKQQHADTERALATAEQSAKAAQRSADISAQALSSSQRAFVFWKGFSCGPHICDDKIKEYVVFAQVENVGPTPALDVCMTIRSQVVRGAAPQPPVFTPDPGFLNASTVLGPRASGQSGYMPISIADLADCWERRAEIYVWSYLQYRDIFDPDKIHHHEQCAKIHLIHEPSTPPPEGHPPYLQFGVHGSQNSAS